MSQRSTRKPKPTEIQPIRRDLQFRLPAAKIDEWHHAAGPHFTTFLNTFSIVLPVGERFFMAAVRSYRDQITDPELKKAVTAFIGQEAMHGREHEEYNDALFAVSKLAPKFEQLVGRLLAFARDDLPRPVALSATIALEHFTALLADSVLREPRISEGADPNFAALWRWHALEETEHKAVAYDVWSTVMGQGAGAYAQRSLGMVAATVIFWALVTPTFLAEVQRQGKLTDVRGWRKFFSYTLGRRGLLSMQLRNYADYFRPSFHPWDHDNREYLKQIDGFVAKWQDPVAAAA